MNIQPNDIEHHGIFGMKWGVRRYQNPDGSLTEAGKKRYNKVSSSEKLQEKETKRASKLYKKISKMSKAEDGSTHLAHAFSIKKSAKKFADNYKDGLGYLKGDANKASVKVTLAMFNKVLDIAQKDLDFIITTNEKAIITALFNKFKADLTDEGSLYKFVLREVKQVRDMRQKAQDTSYFYGTASV